MEKRKTRILMAKVGLDGHDRGIRVLSVLMREAGTEVVYLGLHQKPEHVVQAAIQEDVDVVGISYLSGGQLSYTPEIICLMKENNMNDTLLLVGGRFRDAPSYVDMSIEYNPTIWHTSCVGMFPEIVCAPPPMLQRDI